MTIAATPELAERTAGEKIDDASITAQVSKTALLTHRSTSAMKTKVETREGEFTLTGIANNDAEILVTKLVSDIQGVNKVNNQMTVAEVTKEVNGGRRPVGAISLRPAANAWTEGTRA